MFSATTKMSLETSDVQTDEELVDDEFSLPAEITLEKICQRTRRKSSSGKPPPSPRSPYLCSLNLNSTRAAVGAWRRQRASLGDTRGDKSGESCSARLTSLSNGHDVPQTLGSDTDDSPQLLKQKVSMRTHRPLLFASNGFTVGAGERMEKEDMYDEIIRLKKSLHAQKSDNQQLKARLRSLEEEITKREKQIEELLDPLKGSEYTRSLVDKKKEGSVVVSGLKQRILKLEQQCREKENTLSALQSDLRTTNLKELNITVETYFEEIQRLRTLLDAAEKSSRAESKCSQRQQKALNSTVHHLAGDLKQLQQENAALREELSTDSPAGGIKGYREWSKQRLLRRLLEVEKRLQDSRRHTQAVKSSSGRLEKEVQATLAGALGVSVATETVVSMGVTEEAEEITSLREHLSQSEKERAELQEMLSSKDDELERLRTERDELQRETERLSAEQKKRFDLEKQEYSQELEQLLVRIRTLEEDRLKLVEAELSSPPPPTVAGSHEDAQSRADQEEDDERGAGCTEETGVERDDESRTDAGKKNREKAALIIQTNWRQHRQRDIVMLQSALRGHLFRESQLKILVNDVQNKPMDSLSCSDEAHPVPGELDEVAVTMIQSAFRGHLARWSFAIKSSGFAVPSPAENIQPTLVSRRAGLTLTHRGTEYLNAEKDPKQDLRPASTTSVSRTSHTPAQRELHSSADADADVADESDDSDDIIVSPSRPLRSREVSMS
ncbi:IQ domain-containing protein E [Nematolebias whitei]|uniref:IQ domain-containing protein E n=1 Tax=Nematolebias whitei TaxID=451745 RepID=UPI00189B3C84|nr:IQ domain-containing protein E [Nematolebias whitei]